MKRIQDYELELIKSFLLEDIFQEYMKTHDYRQKYKWRVEYNYHSDLCTNNLLDPESFKEMYPLKDIQIAIKKGYLI